MANENKMGYLPIKKLILQMSLPPMCSMFLQYSYNLVDSMFVANINENALAAVSLSFPITTLMISLSIWIGVGINVLIAGYLGEKEQDLADCATTFLDRRLSCTIDQKPLFNSQTIQIFDLPLLCQQRWIYWYQSSVSIAGYLEKRARSCRLCNNA